MWLAHKIKDGRNVCTIHLTADNGGGVGRSRLGRGRDVSYVLKAHRQWDLTVLQTNEPSLGSKRIVYLLIFGWQRQILTEVCSLAWCVCVCVCLKER